MTSPLSWNGTTHRIKASSPATLMLGNRSLPFVFPRNRINLDWHEELLTAYQAQQT
jgi:hypothetical protein